MREYELTVIYDLAVAEAGGRDASLELLTGVVTARGGTLLKVDHWGRRRMAYPIRRHVDGYYTIMRFRLESQLTEELDRNLRLTEQVMRHLIVRAEEVPTPRPVRRQAVVVEETKE